MLKEFYYKYIELNLKDYPNIGLDFEINKVLFFVFTALIIASVLASLMQSSVALMIKKLLRTSSFGEENARSLPDLGLDKNRFLKFALSRAKGSASLIIKEAGRVTPTYEEYIAAANAEKEKKLEKKRAKKAKRASFLSKLRILDSINNTEQGKDDNSRSSACEEASNENAIEVSTKESPDNSEPTVSSAQLLRGTKPDFSAARFYIPRDMEERALRYYNAKSGSVGKTVLACLAILAFYIALVFLMPTVLTAVNALLEG